MKSNTHSLSVSYVEDQNNHDITQKLKFWDQVQKCLFDL